MCSKISEIQSILEGEITLNDILYENVYPLEELSLKDIYKLKDINPKKILSDLKDLLVTTGVDLADRLKRFTGNDKIVEQLVSIGLGGAVGVALKRVVSRHPGLKLALAIGLPLAAVATQFGIVAGTVLRDVSSTKKTKKTLNELFTTAGFSVSDIHSLNDQGVISIRMDDSLEYGSGPVSLQFIGSTLIGILTGIKPANSRLACDVTLEKETSAKTAKRVIALCGAVGVDTMRLYGIDYYTDDDKEGILALGRGMGILVIPS